MRTVKTLTYLIVHQKGESIVNHLTLIQDREESELCHYIKKALKQSDKLVKTSNKSQNSTPNKMSKAALNELPHILTKIGTDENQNAMIELYEFTQTYPQISLEPYLEKSSDFFKNFITNGLQKIRNERERIQNSGTKTNGTHRASASANGSEIPKRMAFSRVPPPKNQNEAIQWLKSATGALGIDSNKYDSETLSQMNSSDAINSIEAAELAVQRAQQTLEKFKRAYNTTNGQNR